MVNIWSGEEAAEEVNLNKSVEIGLCQMKEYQESLPEGFRERLSTKVITMASEVKKASKRSFSKHRTHIFESIISCS